jgi:hypothetical protein
VAETVRLRLLREPDPPNPDGSFFRFGLQDKKGAMHDGVVRADGLGEFDFEVTVRGSPDQGPPDFGGPFASGTKGARFVYLSWQRLDGGGFMNRIKVRLADIDWPLLAAAHGKMLEADLRGATSGGGNRPVEWRVVDTGI